MIREQLVNYAINKLMDEGYFTEKIIDKYINNFTTKDREEINEIYMSLSKKDGYVTGSMIINEYKKRNK